MLSFLKVFLRGIICTVLLPLILLVWVIYGVYCLVTFIVMFVKSVILFFAGDNAAGELREDIEARKILLEAEQAQFEQNQVVNMMYQSMAAQQMYGQPMMPPPVMPQQAIPQPQVQSEPQPNQGSTLQPAVFTNEPAPEVQQEPRKEFDPFIPDPVQEAPLPEPQTTISGEQPQVNEGDPNNGQSN